MEVAPNPNRVSTMRRLLEDRQNKMTHYIVRHTSDVIKFMAINDTISRLASRDQDRLTSHFYSRGSQWCKARFLLLLVRSIVLII